MVMFVLGVQEVPGSIPGEGPGDFVGPIFVSCSVLSGQYLYHVLHQDGILLQWRGRFSA